MDMSGADSAKKIHATPTQPFFVTQGVLSLEELKARAALPSFTGLEALIAECLQKHLGHNQIELNDIAKEMGYSKRTLQRRLKDKGVQFNEIRDQVRFHYGIDHLLNTNWSISEVSDRLGFTSRTSFTVAFKRWTKLSPQVFRKLYRDYSAW